MHIYGYIHITIIIKEVMKTWGERGRTKEEVEVKIGGRSNVETLFMHEVHKCLNNKIKCSGMHYSTKPFRQYPPLVPVLPEKEHVQVPEIDFQGFVCVHTQGHHKTVLFRMSHMLVDTSR